MQAHEPQIGDVFDVERASGGARVAGRVVSTSAIVGPTHGCILVYLYRDGAPVRGDVRRPDRREGADANTDATREHLLVPPILTLRAPWARGYFVHKGTAPLLPGDFFERHAFRDAQGRLVDEEARPLAVAESGVPIGEWRLFDVDAIEAALRAALK
jgi:hypothetical protein